MSRNDVLVTADWAQEHLGHPGLVFVEVDEDTSAYDGGHLEGAVKLDWKQDLQDPLRRDFVRSEEHTSELQSRQYLVCRLLLEKKNRILLTIYHVTPRNLYLFY